MERLLEFKRQIIFEGPPGSGKTYLANLIARHFAGIPLIGGSDPHVRIVQFHQSYAYEDFIEGIRPETNAAGQIEYQVRSGIFKRVCNQAREEPYSRYVVIIDEINRGNISRIFGELLLLLEYRDLQVELPYQKEGAQFSIPKNVFVIGTMNTTDRSLAQIDYALRRRFFFYRLMPVTAGTAPVLRKWLAVNSGLSSTDQEQVLKLFLNLNARIQKELGEHFQIGHSYFMDRRIGTAAGRKQIWDFAVMPLLEEYFYNRRDRTALLNEFAVDKLIAADDSAPAVSA
jgi:5-methylcytosine-specific restriction protein B